MKQKVSDYIADFLATHGITQIFTVVGGGAMHLNNSLGHHAKLCCLNNHHEQASAMAAECYARVHGRMAVVCVTSGPGAINALNGVIGAYQDSIPMLVLSGQAKSSLCIHACGGKIRTIGGQEADIVAAVRQNMTKYATMVMEPSRIRYELEKAVALAQTGRPGPCWLDIPLDVQGTLIDTDELEGYVPTHMPTGDDLRTVVQSVLKRLRTSKRPVLGLQVGQICFDACMSSLISRLLPAGTASTSLRQMIRITADVGAIWGIVQATSPYRTAILCLQLGRV